VANLTMADLLAKQDAKALRLSRNQEVEGEVVLITETDIILDLGTKSEAILPKKDLPSSQADSLKAGDKVKVFVVVPENEAGQVIVTSQRILSKGGVGEQRFRRFEEAMSKNQILTGKGLEVNKGGLIVEVAGMRGFLPSSQVSLSSASDLGSLIGKDVTVTVLEVDSSQNRLIFSQKGNVSEELKKKLSALKIGDKVKGTVAAVLPFGVFVSIKGENMDGIEGLVHVSELSWERVEDPNTLYKAGDEIEAQVVSIDLESGRVNLSIKVLKEDPFKALSEKYQTDDVVKATITKVAGDSITLKLEDGVEGTMVSDKDTEYKEGESLTVLIDNVDTNKHKITFAPLRTSTKDLIYK